MNLPLSCYLKIEYPIMNDKINHLYLVPGAIKSIKTMIMCESL